MACTDNILRIILFPFNFIMLVLGLFIAGLGLVTCFSDDLNAFEEIKPFIEDFATLDGYLSYILIGAGSIICIVSFFGCCGLARNDPVMLFFYAAIHVILLISFVVIMIFFYPKIKNLKGEDMMQIIQNKFGEYEKYRGIIDPLQKNFKCCGFNRKYHVAAALPYSCCEGTNKTGENSSCPVSNAFKKECKEKIEEALGSLSSILDSENLMKYILIGTAITEIIVIVSSIYLIHQLP